ncbi:MAG: RsmE family RNA methyltransferase, partial [Candidatus Omnitrophota bacterium]
EKTTEIGVTEIIPIITQRTEIRLNDERAGRKQSRYEKIAINAAKQSQRNTLPIIHPCQTFNDAVSRIARTGACVIPWLGGEKKLLTEVLESRKPETSVMVFIGPEGDFSSNEVEQAIKAGAIPVSLGKNVLKVDTAAIVSVTLIRFYLDHAR